jgi:PhoPQ-activated pathogenicity-related protein
MKTSKKVLLLIFIIIVNCRSEKETPQIQTLIENSYHHTHDIIIMYDDVANGREDYYTTINLNHRHKVIINKEEREKLLRGLKIIKETEEELGHKHTIEIKIFGF